MTEQSNDRRNIEPTPQRIQQFRKKGEIALSVELGSTSAMVGGLMVMMLLGTTGSRLLLELSTSTFARLDAQHADELTSAAVRTFFLLAWPVATGAILAYLVCSGFQLGFPPALGQPKFALEKVFALQGLKRLFDAKDAVWRTLKSVLKLGFVAAAAYLALRPELEALVKSSPRSISAIADRATSASLRLAAGSGAALLLLSLVDYVVSRRRWWAKVRMTPEELKRELKEQEGDPEIRRRRRLRMRELARRRLQVNVPKADVVIVNPTHYAVAIRYRAGESGAPRLLAKGRDEVARRIREIARENGIPVVRKPSLARLLYRTVKEGREIPSDAYRAVAEVLAYVYRLRRARA